MAKTKAHHDESVSPHDDGPEPPVVVVPDVTPAETRAQEASPAFLVAQLAQEIASLKNRGINAATQVQLDALDVHVQALVGLVK